MMESSTLVVSGSRQPESKFSKSSEELLKSLDEGYSSMPSMEGPSPLAQAHEVSKVSLDVNDELPLNIAVSTKSLGPLSTVTELDEEEEESQILPRLPVKTANSSVSNLDTIVRKGSLPD